MRSAGGWRRFDRLHRRGTSLRLVGAISPDLQSSQPGGLSGEGYIGHKLSLKHLPGKQQLAVFVLVADGVGDQGAVERQSQPGSKIAYLVGMGKQHQLRLLARDELLQGMYVGV